MKKLKASCVRFLKWLRSSLGLILLGALCILPIRCSDVRYEVRVEQVGYLLHFRNWNSPSDITGPFSKQGFPYDSKKLRETLPPEDVLDKKFPFQDRAVKYAKGLRFWISDLEISRDVETEANKYNP
jgi:hypothetical protein